MALVAIQDNILDHLINIASVMKETADKDDLLFIVDIVAEAQRQKEDSRGLRIFTKEEVEGLEKHFDLGAFFEE